MSRKTAVYCDESGNDGPNYLNASQPFYVLAGWVVPDEAIVDASVAIAKVHNRVCRDAKELKFKTFRKSQGNLEELSKLFRHFGQLGLIPTFLFAEKRYCVGAKIVETFLDPHFNERVGNGFSWDVATKQQLANTFCERLPLATLTRFAQAYQAPTEEGLLEALTDVIEASRDRVNPEISTLLEGSRANLPSLAEAEKIAAESYEKAAGTLNFPCLVSYLMLIENLGKKGFTDASRIVHDEQGPYQSGYQQLFAQLQDAAPNWVTLPGQDIALGGLRKVTSFEIQRSIDQPLVQAADLLAGIVNHLCMKLQREVSLSAMEKELLLSTLPALLAPDLRLAWPICSDRMFSRISDQFAHVTGNETKTAEVLCSIGSGHLPVFPPNQSAEQQAARCRIPLPLYTFARKEDGALTVLFRSEVNVDEAKREEGLILIFSTAEAAEAEFASVSDGWNDTQEVIKVDVPQLQDFLTRVDVASEYAGMILIDPLQEETAYAETKQFAANLRSVLDRMARVFQSGAADELCQHHCIEGRDAVTLLLSNGYYGAAWKDETTLVHMASSRPGALEKLRSHSTSSKHTT